MRDVRTRDDGFTLLEVMFVVLVLGILVMIAVSSYAVTTERSLRITCQQNLRILDSARVMYEQQHNEMPETLSDLSSQVGGRAAYDSCPDGDAPYVYDSITGQIACPNHPLLR